MACHMRIATSNAKFGQPEEVNLGLIWLRRKSTPVTPDWQG